MIFTPHTDSCSNSLTLTETCMDTYKKQTMPTPAVCVSNLVHEVNVDNKISCKINTRRQNTQVTNPAGDQVII